MEVITEYGFVFMVLAVIFGLYMTWGIGANDVANAMGTSVGSRAITVKQAILIAAVFEFAGAFIAGGNVTSTIRKGIVDPSGNRRTAGDPGFRYARRPAGSGHMADDCVFPWLAGIHHAFHCWCADWFCDCRYWPGRGSLGQDRVYPRQLGDLTGAGWFPCLCMLMMSIRRFILDTDSPFESARKNGGPFYVFLLGFIISLVTLFKGLKHLKLDLSVPMSFLAALVFGLVIAINRLDTDS